jgi:hypothetical protein
MLRARVGPHRVAWKLLADEFFRADLGDPRIARWRGRGERVTGLLLAEQLVLTDLRKVPIAIRP